MTQPLWGECGEHVDVGKTWGKCWYIYFPYSPSKWLIHCGENVGNMLMWGKPGENVDTYIFLILLLNDSTIVGRMWGTCWCGKNLGKMFIHMVAMPSPRTAKSIILPASGANTEMGFREDLFTPTPNKFETKSTTFPSFLLNSTHLIKYNELQFCLILTSATILFPNN